MEVNQSMVKLLVTFAKMFAPFLFIYTDISTQQSTNAVSR